MKVLIRCISVYRDKIRRYYPVRIISQNFLLLCDYHVCYTIIDHLDCFASVLLGESRVGKVDRLIQNTVTFSPHKVIK